MDQFAVIKTGGKQYLVKAGQKLKVEKLGAKTGDSFEFDEVLLVVGGKDLKIGTPLVPGARVSAKVFDQGRHDKKIIFRYHSKTRYRKKKGHRQPFTEVEILGINK